MWRFRDHPSRKLLCVVSCVSVVALVVPLGNSIHPFKPSKNQKAQPLRNQGETPSLQMFEHDTRCARRIGVVKRT